MHDTAQNDLAFAFGAIASEAGQAIMAIYSPALKVASKANGSPVSEADTAAELLILDALKRLLPEVPVVAEESYDVGAHTAAPARFLLVDPLDGTREFITGSNEFTVNIALVEQGKPVVGCVYAPALKQIYLGGTEAFRATLEAGAPLPAPEAMQKLATAAYPPDGLRAMASRSHLDAESEAYLQRLKIGAFRAAGSSLKFCLIAQGDGDIYPRLAPTMEWDTAAGHAVLTAAGGCVIGRDGSPFRYGKAGFRNDGFVAWGRQPLP
jgi:3'(2'), 5'-bisphosphate nucleotidase